MDSTEIQINTSTKKALVVGNLEFKSATDFLTTAEDLNKAYEELNGREDIKQDCLQELKKRFERDEGILYRTDDKYLLCYLRYAKFNCDKAYNSMRKLYSLRLRHPEIHSLPSNLETLLNYRYVTILPYKDQEGRLLMLTDCRNWNVDEMSFNEALCAISAIYDIFYMNPHCQITGTVSILDTRGMSLKHLSQMLHPSLFKSIRLTQECYPIRRKVILFIHCNSVVRIWYSAIRKFMKKKIADRVKFLGSDMSELHQYVNPAVLPKEYGGSVEEDECRITDLVMNNLPYLKYERSFGWKSTS